MATRRKSEQGEQARENASVSEHAKRVVEQAGLSPYAPVLGLRERAWELHLRGLPKTRIAQTLGLDRGTVARYIQACYRDISSERRITLERKVSGAVARMRRIQEQAWDDHDADDARERTVLRAMLDMEHNAGEDSDNREQEPAKGRSMVRYQSQRSQYLRLALDAEKEIARLEGLYEASGDEGGTVVLRIERLGAGEVRVTGNTGTGDQAVDGGEADGDSSQSSG